MRASGFALHAEAAGVYLAADAVSRRFVVDLPAKILPMSWWNSLFRDEESARDVDYYSEGVQLLRAGAYHEAVTSFRLALRETPNDLAILQQIAIAYTRIGMTDEAVRVYQTVLQQDPGASGAHYGLAFLMLRDGRREEAVRHLQRFLADTPASAEASQHVDHARRTLDELMGGRAPDATGERTMGGD